MTNETVSIVIVNFNSGNKLKRCLEYVWLQTHTNWELIIVDNASTDDSLLLVEESERITVIRNRINRGFAAGQNQGLHAGKGPYLMSLNYDIRMSPTFLSELLKGIEKEERIGSVCGKQLKMTTDWEPTNIIDSTGLIMPPSLEAAQRGYGQKDEKQFDKELRVLGALGAAPLFRRDMLENIAFEEQYYDEQFFTWYEDVDLDWRAFLFGWECRYVPNAIAYHIGHPDSDRRNAFHVHQTVRNRWMMLYTNLGLDEIKVLWKGMLKHEIALLIYVLRGGFFFAYLAAVKDSIAKNKYVRRKRAWVRKHTLRGIISMVH